MRYWTLFTLRMMARVGLLMSLLIWWYSQSTTFLAWSPFPARSVGLLVNSMGVGILDYATPVGRPLTYEFGDSVNPNATRTAFDAAYTRTAPHLPGLYYYSGTQTAGNSVMLIEHWLVSLMFLTLAILTSLHMIRNRAPFVLRMTARAGLSGVMVCWLVSQWQPFEARISFGATSVIAGGNERQLGANVLPSKDAWQFALELPGGIEGSVPGYVSTPGLQVFRDANVCAIGIDHWLSCLTFLVATIATSVKWSWTGRHPVSEVSSV